MVDQTKVSNKPILVGLGLFVPGFSFTRVFDSLFEQLSVYFEIHWYAIAYKDEVTRHKHYTLHPCNLKGGDMYGAYGAATLAIKLKATALLLLNDVYMLKNYQSAWMPLKTHGIKLAAYTPLDGTIIDYNILKDAVFLDALVLYHDGAKKDVQRAINCIEENEPSTSYEWPALYTIYHGVDVSSFQPIVETSKKELKKKLFAINNSEDSIFILNANRYNERKNIEATIDAFSLSIAHFRQPTYLVLHTPNTEPLKRKTLESYILSSGCSEYILLNPLGEYYCDDAMLNQLYQACDIGVNTSYGEGWGLISFEHAACGGAQIVPDHTCPGEIWKNIAITTPSHNEIKLPTNPFMMYNIDIKTLSHQMIELTNEKEKRVQVAIECMDHANDHKFKWATIAKVWSDIL